MTSSPNSPAPARRNHVRIVSAASAAALLVVGPLAGSAHAAAEVPPLGTTSAFSILAGSGVTNVGATTVDRSIGTHPTASVTGENTIVVGGTVHKADAVALQAKTDLTAAYNQAAGQTPPIAADPELGGETLPGGVYNRADAMALNGVLTLDGQNDPDSIWVFQAGSTLTTGSGASVVLIRDADPCNVFWQVGSSATFGTTTNFVGTVMANISIQMQTGARILGRTLARSGAVTLDNNVYTSPGCAYDTDVDDAVEGETPGGTPGGTGGGTGGTDGGTGNGGTGTGDNGTGGGGGTGNGGGGGGDDQIPKVPTGSVDTGVVGSSTGTGTGFGASALAGWTMAGMFGGVALVALRRRRLM